MATGENRTETPQVRDDKNDSPCACGTHEKLSIAEAARRGISRLRQPQWANPMDHLKITIIAGSVAPLVRLYAPFNKECNGRDPVVLFLDQPNDRIWLEYTGPLPDSPEYKAEQAKFNGVLSDKET